MCVRLARSLCGKRFPEWARYSLSRCEWALASYDQHGARGKQHHPIIRSLNVQMDSHPLLLAEIIRRTGGSGSGLDNVSTDAATQEIH